MKPIPKTNKILKKEKVKIKKKVLKYLQTNYNQKIKKTVY